jgi:DNA-binding IclR family transcriptional regulator
MYINSLESKQAIRMTLDIGMRKPACSTAAGKVMLAFQPADVVEKVLAEDSHIANMSAGPDEFRQELAQIRSRGYALADEENEVGVRSLAAPVRDYAGNVIAAASIAGPAQRLTRKVLAGFAPEVVSAAEAISARLGYHPLRLARRHRMA